MRLDGLKTVRTGRNIRRRTRVCVALFLFSGPFPCGASLSRSVACQNADGAGQAVERHPLLSFVAWETIPRDQQRRQAIGAAIFRRLSVRNSRFLVHTKSAATTEVLSGAVTGCCPPRLFRSFEPVRSDAFRCQRRLVPGWTLLVGLLSAGATVTDNPVGLPIATASIDQ